MTTLKALILCAGLAAVSAPAAMIPYYGPSNAAEVVRTQYFESALAVGPLPTASWRGVWAFRREE